MEVVEILIHDYFDNTLLNNFNKSLDAIIEPCVVVLDIKSFGGECECLEKMELKINEMKSKGFVFVTNVDEYAYSCGFMLFILGDIRTVSDTAELMFHAPAIDYFGRMTEKDAKEMVVVLENVQQLCDRLIVENTTVTPENYSIMKKSTTFFNKADLIHFGIMELEYKL